MHLPLIALRGRALVYRRSLLEYRRSQNAQAFGPSRPRPTTTYSLPGRGLMDRRPFGRGTRPHGTEMALATTINAPQYSSHSLGPRGRGSWTRGGHLSYPKGENGSDCVAIWPNEPTFSALHDARGIEHYARRRFSLIFKSAASSLLRVGGRPDSVTHHSPLACSCPGA